MKARLKIAYSDEAWSMIGEIEGRKSVRLEDCDLPEAAAVIITKKEYLNGKVACDDLQAA